MQQEADREVVLEAVQQKGSALELLSKEFEGCGPKHAAPEEKVDREVVLEGHVHARRF